MPVTESATRIAWMPFLLGFSLWTGATALLLEDAYITGHITVQHALMPVLTASTVAAAVFVHKRLMQLKLFASAVFALLAILGSGLTVHGTMGRVANQSEVQASEARTGNEAYQRKLADLEHAKGEQKRECKVRGQRCALWDLRVDTLTRELEGRTTVSENPRIDAAVRLAVLLTGVEPSKVRSILQALEPVSLPLFLEFGSIVFFASAFPTVKVSTVPEHLQSAPAETVVKVFTLADAHADFQQLKASNSQAFLADRWGVSESTVSRWLTQWQNEGLVHRARNGKRKTLALPSK